MGSSALPAAWKDTPYRTRTWDELVIYELHVGTFNDQPGGGPGSFASVVQRLAYLKDLGVTAIELMPAMEFALDFSWGYNAAAYLRDRAGVRRAEPAQAARRSGP